MFNFHLEQAEREVLDFMKAYFSFNPKIRENILRPKTKQTYSLAISSKADLLKLISFLNNNDINFIGLKANKKKQYDIWLTDFHLKHGIIAYICILFLYFLTFFFTIAYYMLEPYAMKVARTVLKGGKFEKTYLSYLETLVVHAVNNECRTFL